MNFRKLARVIMIMITDSFCFVGINGLLCTSEKWGPGMRAMARIEENGVKYARSWLWPRLQV
jgi:hypothetical protein